MPTKTFYATKDAFMTNTTDNNSPGWNGFDAHLPVGLSGAGGLKYRSVVYFPIDFTGMKSITSANIYLYDHTTGSDRHCIQTNPPSTINWRRVTSDWGEGTSNPGEGFGSSGNAWNWNTTASANTPAGAGSRTIDQGGNGTEQAFFCTAIVNDWFEGAVNYGVIFYNGSESSAGRGLQFFSRSNGDSDRVPRIVIDYVENTPPNEPTNLVPRLQTASTTVPTFSGTRDDDDVGDYITATQIKVWTPNRSYRWKTATTATDPTSGYIKSNDGLTVYVSETGTGGTALDYSGIQGLFVASRLNPSTYKMWYNRTVYTDNGTWNTMTFVTSFSAGTFSDGEEVRLFFLDSAGVPTSTPIWDSGTVSVTGNAISFSIPYGSTGTADPLVGNTPYIWTARTRDRSLAWGPFARVGPFRVNTTPSTPTVQVLSSPINDINDNTPTFSIKHNDVDLNDQFMYGYQIVVEKWTGSTWTTTGGWDSGNVTVSPVVTKQVDSGGLAFGGLYRVKARTQDSSSTWSNFSAPIQFTLHHAGVPINLNPSGGESTGATPYLAGDSAYSADVITAFWLSAYSSDLSVSVLAPTRYTDSIYGGGLGFSKLWPGSALTAGQSYVWKTRVETSVGDISDWSPNQLFIVTSPSVPNISSPTGTGNSLTPTISGSRTTTFNRFKYEIYPSTSTTANLGTALYQSASLSSTITGSGPTTFSTTYGGSPALTSGTQYKIRVAVSADAGATWSDWSGLVAWVTDTALLGSAYLPSPGQWISTLTPSFYISAGGSEVIDQFQVRVWNDAETNLWWDSGMTDVTNTAIGAGPIVYSGPTLTGGVNYKWEFRYKKTTGAVGGYAPKVMFHVNGAPSVPTDNEPHGGRVLLDSDDLVFSSTFGDPDQESYGDYPTDWYIRLATPSGTVLYDKHISAGLVDGNNSYTWAPGDYPIALSTPYAWTNWYVDSKGATGAYAPFAGFRQAQPPNGQITTPTNGSTVDVVNPEINWTFTGGTQQKFRIRVFETDSHGNRVSGGALRYQTPGTDGLVTSFALSYRIPPSYLKNFKYYDIELFLVSSDGLGDPTPDVVNVQVQTQAPDPVTGLSVTTYPTRSRVDLDWTTWQTQSGHTFMCYYIYRRLTNDEDFTLIGTVTSRTVSNFTDWYAGHDVQYQYRVSVATIRTVSGEQIELESPDDPNGGNLAFSTLVCDDWYFVGGDRNPDHIQMLPVNDEDHNRPVQQESFETLGSNRKVIIRGFVLGNEGNITLTYNGSALSHLPSDSQTIFPETVLGRRLVDYLTFYKGPHILKSPFGDVWDVEFAGPQYKWIKGGHLEVTLSWIETGQTSLTGSI